MNTINKAAALTIAVPLAMIAGALLVVALPFLALGLLVLGFARWVLE